MKDGHHSVFLDADEEEYWSVMDEMTSPVQGSSTGRCLAMSQQGELAVLDCAETTGAVACKKPLSRVFAMTTLLNQSAPVPHKGQLDFVHLFERVLPPLLTSLPSHGAAAPLEMLEVTTDTHCAFRCYR
ncbi:hypothetical protein ElyMa_000704700 [Elysia marginata]|uniref:Uncharacterized protein n=1 Tax=Elysia marginata TaxID=1093978 RepID=A0AAV4GJ99_9GAST|nr:hypothetical protein ElyMa_000704700 [Elysia marginata]